MTNKTFYRGFTLIDGKGAGSVENAGLVVEDSKVVKVGKENEIKVEEDVKTVDLTGKTIIPGMINAHVHITMEPVGNSFELMMKESASRIALRGTRNLEKHLKSGITYFRDLGGPKGVDIELRNAVKEGIIQGPEFLASGNVITMTGGHGWPLGRECDGRDEVRKATREQLKAGADIIKIMATGGVLTPGVEPGSPQLTLEEMKVAVEEAHKAGKKTATHAQGTSGIRNAILAGIDSVEHGIFLDDEVIELMVQNDVYLVATLVAPYFIIKHGIDGGIPEYAVEKSKRVMDSHLESFRKAKEAGVKIAMGTDAGTPFNYHDKAPYELKLMMDCGMSAMEAIVSATSEASKLLAIDKEYGTLEEGKFADFLVLNENPLENIDTLFNIDRVYKLGKLVK